MTLTRSVFYALILSLYTVEQRADNNANRQIVISIDDVPGAIAGSDTAKGKVGDLRDWNRAILAALRKHHVSAIGFVNESKLQVDGERDARAELLRDWINAGMSLGNHTYSHVSIRNAGLIRFEDDTIRGSVVANELLRASGRGETYFRHPSLERGEDPERGEFQRFLNARGYRIAPVTVDNADYMFDDARSALKPDDVTSRMAVDRLYQNFTKVRISYVEHSSKALLGRLVPQILLIHDSELNADNLDAILSALEDQGYHFVSLDTALRDPAYGEGLDPRLNLATCYLCWSVRLAAMGRPDAASPLPLPPSYIVAASEARRAGSAGQQ